MTDALGDAHRRLTKFFDREDRYGDEFDDGQEARAKEVLRHLQLAYFDVCNDAEHDAYTLKLNQLIAKNLDADSMWAFVRLAADSHNHMHVEVNIDQKVKEQIRAVSAQKAHKRHKETNLMQIESFKWLDANMLNFNSMDAAAQAITKQQPIAFRTARKWVSEWKKLRSAGRL